MEDVVTAFNEARHQLPDDFDKLRSDNMKFYTSHAQDWVTAVAQDYGYDGVSSIATYGAALAASTGEVLLNFVQGVGAATFFDPLRVGDGVKKGTAGGYFEDALRVMGVVGGALKLLKFAKYMRGASQVGGGLMSCLPTSAAKAISQARIIGVPTVEEMAQGSKQILGPGTVRFPAPYYNGATWAEVLPNIEKAGMTVEAKPVGSMKQVFDLVNQNKGPVLLGVEWQPVMKGGQLIPGGRHALMAYRPFFGSGIRLADQFGNLHTIEVVNGVESLKMGADATSGGMLGAFPNQIVPGMTMAIKAVHSEAFIVRDVVLLDVAANLPLAQRVGVPLYEAIDDEFWPKVGFAASLMPTAPPKLKGVGNATRAAIRNNPKGSSGPQPSKAPAGAGIPLSSGAQKMLGLIGQPGSTMDWKILRAKALAAGLHNPREYEAIKELEGWGAITVQRVGADELTIISVTRNQ
jgi:hypothetical protein